MNELTFTNIFKIGLAVGRLHEQKIWEKMFYDSPELLFTVSGNGIISYKDKTDTLHSGDLIVYNSLPRHQFKRENDVPGNYMHEGRLTFGYFGPDKLCRIQL